MFKIILVAALLTVCSFGQARSVLLEEKNSVQLRNEVNDSTITKLQFELAQKVADRGSKDYTIYLVLDSPGGSIDSGLNFIEFAKSFKNVETITIFAASMAAGIVEALPGKRLIIESGVLMFHRASGGIQGQFEDGELESRLNLYKKIVRGMEQTNADRMQMSLELYKLLVKDELWITGGQSVGDGAADEVITLVCSQELINSKIDESFSIMGLFEIDVSFSGCPLIKGGKVKSPEAKEHFEQYKKAKNWRSL
jgi:ATP-dependent protease ClpP protease subunit